MHGFNVYTTASSNEAKKKKKAKMRRDTKKERKRILRPEVLVGVGCWPTIEGWLRFMGTKIHFSIRFEDYGGTAKEGRMSIFQRKEERKRCQNGKRGARWMDSMPGDDDD